MKQIKCLVKDIRDEMEGAEHYAKLAVQYKDTDRTLADTYAKMSEAELGHVDLLHSQAVRSYKGTARGGLRSPCGHASRLGLGTRATDRRRGTDQSAA